MANIRKQRVADLLLSYLGSALNRFHDDKLTFVTFTGVELTQDLKIAKVFWTTPAFNKETQEIKTDEFPNDERVTEVSESLELARKELKKGIAKELQLRYTPELKFAFDSSQQQGTRIDALLKQAGF